MSARVVASTREGAGRAAQEPPASSAREAVDEADYGSSACADGASVRGNDVGAVGGLASSARMDGSHASSLAESDAFPPSFGAQGASAMPEVEAIRSHPLYQAWYARLVEAERGREFCCHQLPHLLDVARIAYIRVLERHLPFRKEVVYAAAILHDIGKAAQYDEGEPHEAVGARIAQEILMDVSAFNAREKTMIVAAVAQHRRWSQDSTPLGKLLYEADKASRPCFSCPMRDACSWPPERMNAGVGI